MKKFTIPCNDFLHKETVCYYQTDYVGYKKEGNPDYLVALKNTFKEVSDDDLIKATKTLGRILLNDWTELQRELKLKSLTVCVIPRAKAELSYTNKQLLFKKTIKKAIKHMPKFTIETKFIDGTDYILRQVNTKTTHLRKMIEGHNNDGDSPYVGITQATCKISDEVKGKNILLVDDLYTKTVNIDEDAIQALLNKGAKSVILYVVGKTVSKSKVVPNDIL